MNATGVKKPHIEDELNQPNTFDAVRNMTYVPEDRALIRTEDVYQTQTEHGVEGYGPEVLRICATFDNAGVLEGANAVGMCGRSKHGEEMALVSMMVDPETLVVRDAAFRASGTLAMIASASLAAEMARGRTLDEVLEITGPCCASVWARSRPTGPLGPSLPPRPCAPPWGTTTCARGLGSKRRSPRSPATPGASRACSASTAPTAPRSSTCA